MVVGRVVAVVAGLAVVLATGAVPVEGSSPGPVPRTCHGYRATILGTGGDDTLVGTAHRDVIVAGAGWDTVRGRGGDDVICGGDGADRLDGGPGDDRVHGGRGGIQDNGRDPLYLESDRLWGGPGDDFLDGGRDGRDLPVAYPDMVDYYEAAHPIVLDLAAGTASGQGEDRLSIQAWFVWGSPHDDVLLGGRYGDELVGGLGADRLDGRGGADMISGDPWAPDPTDEAPDVLLGRGGDDRLNAGAGEDLLRGGAGDDVLGDSGHSADRIFAGRGDDSVRDTLVPGDGQVLDGGPGSNRLDLVTSAPGEPAASGTIDLRSSLTTVDWPVETVVPTAGFTALRPPEGPWTIYGTDVAERIRSGVVGPRTIYAGGGDDVLGGTEDDDYVDGGTGRDTVRESGGSDTCVNVEEAPANCPAP